MLGHGSEPLLLQFLATWWNQNFRRPFPFVYGGVQSERSGSGCRVRAWWRVWACPAFHELQHHRIFCCYMAVLVSTSGFSSRWRWATGPVATISCEVISTRPAATSGRRISAAALSWTCSTFPCQLQHGGSRCGWLREACLWQGFHRREEGHDFPFGQFCSHVVIIFALLSLFHFVSAPICMLLYEHLPGGICVHRRQCRLRTHREGYCDLQVGWILPFRNDNHWRSTTSRTVVILDDVFMREYYMKFDAGQKRLGYQSLILTHQRSVFVWERKTLTHFNWFRVCLLRSWIWCVFQCVNLIGHTNTLASALCLCPQLI